jgi:mono/diheme cytochrome c family protein
MIRPRPLTLIVSGLLTIGLLTACGNLLASDLTPPPNYTPPAVLPQAQSPTGTEFPKTAPDPQQGQALFAEKCAPCHGVTGAGDGRMAAQLPVTPPAIGTSAVIHTLIPANMFAIVTNGNLGQGMPPFSGSLTDAQRWNVIAYVYSLSSTPATVAQGKTVYDAQCASCHGADGRNNGDFTDQASLAKKADQDLYTVTSSGAKDMPGYADKLDEGQRWAVVSYIRSLTLLGGAQPASPVVQAATATELPATATPSGPTATTDPNVTPTLTPEASVTPPFDLSKATPTITGTPFYKGTIRGNINMPAGKPLPTGLKVNLLGFDNMQNTLDLTAEVKDDGTYVFENVEMNSGRVFIVQVEYNAIGYSSDMTTPKDSATELTLPINIRDTSTDTSVLRTSRMHIFFDYSQADLVQVVELYMISNPTDKVITGAKTGDPVITFKLPKGAANLQFQDGAIGDRYVKTSDGFGDTLSISPDKDMSQQTQILFAFDLPYKTGVQFSLEAPIKTDAVSVMIPNAGVTLKSAQLVDGGTQDVQGMSLHVFNGSGLAAGAKIDLELKGRPETAPVSAVNPNTNTTSLLIGGAGLAIVLIAIGVWLFIGRKPKAAAALPSDAQAEAPTADASGSEENADAMIDAIAALDDLYKGGNLPESVYRQRRNELKDKLKALLK